MTTRTRKTRKPETTQAACHASDLGLALTYDWETRVYRVSEAGRIFATFPEANVADARRVYGQRFTELVAARG